MSLEGKVAPVPEKAGVDCTPHQASTFRRFAIAMAITINPINSQFLEQPSGVSMQDFRLG